MMKKISVFLSTMLLLTMFFTSFTDAATESQNNAALPKEAEFQKILSIDIGNGEQEVAYSQPIDGVANEGPASFAVNENGDIYILDTLNKKILIYKDLKWSSNIDVSYCDYPRDIVAKENKLYILDESNVIYKTDNKGYILSANKLPNNLEAYEIKQISVNNEGNIIANLGDKEYEIRDDSYFLKNGASLETKNNGKTMDIIKNGNVFSSISFAELTGGINIIQDNPSGNTYIEVIDDIPDSPMVLVESTLRMLDKDGNQVAFARIPLEDYYNYPLRFFNITNKDEIYIMALKKDFVEIDKVILGNKYISKVDKLKVKAKKEKDKLINNKVETATLQSMQLTRSQVQTRANAMISLNWTYNAINSSNPSPSTVDWPDYLSSISAFPSSQIGIPYCWGGFDGIDRSSSSGWSNFSDAMSKGKFAGNINCNGGWKSNTAGLDCSGFVSAAYGFTTKYNTTSFASMGSPTSSILSMDYYVASGSHILLYNGDQNTTTIYSKESTTSGTDKTKNYTRTKSWLSTNGYVARTLW